ncbi:MAG: MBOAT family protein [Acidobacteria bacterium]|nr:MBOAT family protein [Acidobacteriota bacterium]MYH29027.1 MBOAT family protein [Acidobacteriota bacterium]MYK87118.1 MBOAT family protein [Acidobacteriota bacterium]
MTFTDWRFLFVFLPAVLGLHFLVARLSSRGAAGGRLRFEVANWILVAGGLAFLAAGAGRFAAVLGGAAAGLYVLGRGIAGAHRRPPAVRPDRIGAVPEICFSLAITGSIGLFAFFRGLNPFAGEALLEAGAFGMAAFPAPGLLAPLGLSVFVCHAVSYAADIHRGEAAAPRNPVHALTYLLLFPFLVAGPIVRFRDVSAHLAARQVGMAAFAYGVRRFTIGLVKAWLIAETLAPPATLAFSMPAGALDAAHAWLGLACFTLQIYFALSGYADMAIGLGRMLGFRLPEHFQWPYAADSLHGFWRRWAMTLVAWFDAYVRLPLRPDPGRTAGRETRAVLSLLLLFLLIALWHGPSWPLLLWGAWHGAAVALERTPWRTVLARLPAPVRHGYVLLVVAAGWILFRADSPADAVVFVQALVGLGAEPSLNNPLPLTGGVQIALAVGAVAAAPLLPAVSRWSVTVDSIATALQMIVTAAALFVWTRLLRQGRRR